MPSDARHESAKVSHSKDAASNGKRSDEILSGPILSTSSWKDVETASVASGRDPRRRIN
jgi:hypothetical protein